jgi:quercetin dioxygenase-like cupin family protein
LKGDDPGLERAVEQARIEGKEIRWYYRNLVTSDGKEVPARVIVTEIPSGHIQPWHLHESIHELSLVEQGQIINVDEPETQDRSEILKRGKFLGQGDMVVETPKVRHTIANFSEKFATFVTIQVANVGPFKIDWK